MPADEVLVELMLRSSDLYYLSSISVIFVVSRGALQMDRLSTKELVLVLAGAVTPSLAPCLRDRDASNKMWICLSNIFLSLQPSYCEVGRTIVLQSLYERPLST